MRPLGKRQQRKRSGARTAVSLLTDCLRGEPGFSTIGCAANKQKDGLLASSRVGMVEKRRKFRRPGSVIKSPAKSKNGHGDKLHAMTSRFMEGNNSEEEAYSCVYGKPIIGRLAHVTLEATMRGGPVYNRSQPKQKTLHSK